MLLSFVAPYDPVLTKIARKISPAEIKTKKYQELIDSMLRLARGEQDKKIKQLVGLAAPQVGYSLEIVVVDTIADGKGKLGSLEVFINPEVLWHSEKTNEWAEGCFSTDDIRGVVDRWTKIKIRYSDELGKVHQKIFSGYTARIFQHEIDHLNAIEFVNHISDPEKLHWVHDEDVKEYRDKQGWRNWPHKATFEEWRRIKGISK